MGKPSPPGQLEGADTAAFSAPLPSLEKSCSPPHSILYPPLPSSGAHEATGSQETQSLAHAGPETPPRPGWSPAASLTDWLLIKLRIKQQAWPGRGRPLLPLDYRNPLRQALSAAQCIPDPQTSGWGGGGRDRRVPGGAAWKQLQADELLRVCQSQAAGSPPGDVLPAEGPAMVSQARSWCHSGSPFETGPLSQTGSRAQRGVAACPGSHRHNPRTSGSWVHDGEGRPMSNWLLSQRAPELLPRDTGGISVTSPCWEPGLSGVTLTTSIVPSGKWVGTPLS